MSDSKMSESEKIWEEIKDKPIEAFGLQDQKVQNHVKRIDIPGKELYVKLNASAFLPWLETAIGRAFEVELCEGFVTVKRAVNTSSNVKKALKSM